MSQSQPNKPSTNANSRYKFQLFLYGALWTLLIPVLFIRFCIKWLLARPGYTVARLSRFAIFPANIRRTDVLWHCVSVGEVTAIAPLAKELLTIYPNISITVTTTTPTGAQQVARLLTDKVQHCYLPYDHAWFMRRLVNIVNPKILLITEVELWPNLLSACTKAQIPSMLINARMTERSAKRYAKLGRFLTLTLQQFSYISAQSKEDAARYVDLGADSSKVHNTGNIKFEIAEHLVADGFVAQLDTYRRAHKATIIIAGSTHAPEEQLAIDAHCALKQKHTNLITCIVPRHPQRFDDVKQLLIASGRTYCCYSDGIIAEDAEFVLIDAMGVMHDMYAIADIAFVGGSFAERGGHNALEPALYSVPIVMGPSQYNNPQITGALSASGALKTVLNEQDFIKQLDLWLTDPAARQHAGKQGFSVIADNRGALQTNLQLIGNLLNEH
ncbi:3-deoxy-D-manno-octulosonic acid transferase [Alteromonas facilis]|uniref:3-deoxy-D-manno-octulosonic acid transferase n=1 Tax=Alteromonas facilis TaxID=2048004 RepID=UPI000F5CDEB3|nr:3-deoxy-D-manno-octulosonic acid transferase [Alteromonas facilis]